MKPGSEIPYAPLDSPDSCLQQEARDVCSDNFYYDVPAASSDYDSDYDDVWSDNISDDMTAMQKELDILTSRARLVQSDRHCRRAKSSSRRIIEDYEEKWWEDFNSQNIYSEPSLQSSPISFISENTKDRHFTATFECVQSPTASEDSLYDSVYSSLLSSTSSSLSSPLLSSAELSKSLSSVMNMNIYSEPMNTHTTISMESEGSWVPRDQRGVSKNLPPPLPPRLINTIKHVKKPVWDLRRFKSFCKTTVKKSSKMFHKSTLFLKNNQQSHSNRLLGFPEFEA